MKTRREGQLIIPAIKMDVSLNVSVFFAKPEILIRKEELFMPLLIRNGPRARTLQLGWWPNFVHFQTFVLNSFLINASFWEKSKRLRERRERENNTVNNGHLRLPRSPDCTCTPKLELTAMSNNCLPHIFPSNIAHTYSFY
jgi:hypothetical protein